MSRAAVKKPKGKPAGRSATAVVEPSTAGPPRGAGPAQEPTAPPRKPAFYEALAVYEAGVRALQRHDYVAGAEGFRGVLQRFPEERELVERARLYLQVCERENARRPATPQTASERVYAATVALNAGDQAAALDHLAKALEAAPDSDHAHYIMAVALTDKGESSAALQHLQRAIRLNPDNRVNALQDPDLTTLREAPEFQHLLGAGHDSGDLSTSKKKLRQRR